MTALQLPPDYPHIKLVASFEELMGTPLAEGIQALCWPRLLEGDFTALMPLLPSTSGITPLEDEFLASLTVRAGCEKAIATLLADLAMLRAQGLDPMLEVINGYLREANPGPVPTDVCDWHVDSATAEADTFLCTYHGAASQLLRTDQAQLYIDDPGIRAALLAEYGDSDDESFAEHLADHCYDLHYLPLPGAAPITCGIGHLWRLSTQHPTVAVPPCIHRAPLTMPGETPRLLLIC